MNADPYSITGSEASEHINQRVSQLWRKLKATKGIIWDTGSNNNRSQSPDCSCLIIKFGFLEYNMHTLFIGFEILIFFRVWSL